MKVYVHWHPGCDTSIVVQDREPYGLAGRLFTHPEEKNYAVYKRSYVGEDHIFKYLSQFLIPNDKSSCHVLEI